MDPIQQAAIDQASATFADNLAPMLRRLFEALKSEGFSEVDAMSIVRAYIAGASGAKIA